MDSDSEFYGDLDELTEEELEELYRIVAAIDVAIFQIQTEPTPEVFHEIFSDEQPPY